MHRFIVVVLAALLFASEALAGGIAVVDFQRAINEVEEGKQKSAELEQMFQQKRTALKNMENQILQQQATYEKQAMVLEDSVRRQREQELMQAQMSFQQTYQQSELEMQQRYAQIMEALVAKMQEVATAIAKERGYDVVLESTGVVYRGPGAADITDEVIKRYNAKSGQ